MTHHHDGSKVLHYLEVRAGLFGSGFDFGVRWSGEEILWKGQLAPRGYISYVVHLRPAALAVADPPAEASQTHKKLCLCRCLTSSSVGTIKEEDACFRVHVDKLSRGSCTCKACHEPWRRLLNLSEFVLIFYWQVLKFWTIENKVCWVGFGFPLLGCVVFLTIQVAIQQYQTRRYSLTHSTFFIYNKYLYFTFLSKLLLNFNNFSFLFFSFHPKFINIKPVEIVTVK